MDADSFTRMISEKDARIAALVAYVRDLERLVRETREQIALEASWPDTDQELSLLRSDHGLRAGTFTLR